MANPDRLGEDLNFEFDSRSDSYYQNQSWSMSIDQMESMGADVRRNISPIQTSAAGLRQTTMAEHPMMDNWRYQHLQQQQQQQQHQQQQQTQSQQQNLPHQQHQPHAHLNFEQTQQALEMAYNNTYGVSMPPPMAISVATSQPTMDAALQMDQPYAMPPGIDGISHGWGDLQSQLIEFNTQELGVASPYQQQTSSPTGSHLEVLSQPSSTDEHSWTFVSPDHLPLETYERHTFFVDPMNTLRDRPHSESSFSDPEQPAQFMRNLEMGPIQGGYSPTTFSDSSEYEYSQPYHGHIPDNQALVVRDPNSITLIRPIAIPTPSKPSSPVRSPASAGSAGSPGRPGKLAKKSPIAAKNTDNRVSKKSITNEKMSPTEKRVGRRKGPLKPEQRKQASEIRKLRACLRCKFLKKTCDKGDPCSGCQPSHARLWQVPCTRIDIKEIGYFLKDRRFDYERHVSLGFSIGNIKGFADVEKTLFITHGYGHMLPVTAREVYVRDDKCLKMDWMEANRDPNGYEVSTAKLSAGTEGISTTMLSDYLDRHIDGTGTFEKFVDDYFEGTPFLSQMLKVAYRFYFRTNSRIIKKALKLMLAYNLTLHITMVEGIPNEAGFVGKIEDESSRFYGKTMAPVMINFQIKCAMADMWRELHKDVLEELSALYSSVYSGDKLKNWPTIFILASVLLAVWECMQFDCHYRVPDESAVNKFCTDMETTPVGVIVGLFSAISQKLPSILEWDTSKHHTLLASNPDVCETMTEVRDHVTNYENYLRDRPNAKFDSKDFDSLSNKFLARLVLRDIRAN